MEEGQAAAEPTLRLEGIHKSYGAGTAHETEVLHGIDLSLARGEFAALIGPSGSGKSTLLNIIGLLDKPSTGKLFLRAGSRTPGRQGTHAAARAGHRLRVPVSQPAARVHRGGERDAAAAGRARQARRGDARAPKS
jgi:ABC-type glutathione transport system ATPase component